MPTSYTRKPSHRVGLHSYTFRTAEGETCGVLASNFSDAIAAYRRSRLRVVA